ncbi:MAG: DUF1893 domain-containing protein [Rikenellaceae bacterium]
MKTAFEILNEGNYSLVIKNSDKIYTYTSRGVADLYNIISSGSQILNGSEIADKIIGKGAASLMIKGGVKWVETHTISSNALELFRLNGIDVKFGLKVPFIENRAKTGWCPVETICKDCCDIDKLFDLIEEFILESKN